MKHWQLALAALLLLLTSSCGESVSVSEFAIIPEPVYLVQKGRSFTMDRSTKLCFENLGQNTPTAKYIASSLRRMHIRPAFIGHPERNCITFALTDSVNHLLGNEGYSLKVKPEGIYISANTEAGLFYGYQTLIQLFPDDITTTSYHRVTLPECTIVDYPRFEWRGSHLDVCRHFFSVKQIEKHLDLMAAYKLNRFHWHLSDDQGWRIEIEKYPQLNDVGSWRVDRDDVQWGDGEPARPGEEPTYGGYYTKQDIAEIVEYAAQRHIEVVPEIEIPGHCSAVLASYPEFACDDYPYTVAVGPYWPPKAILCAGNDEVLQFLYDVMDEVAQMFPGEYIHIGGGETYKDNWETCPKCHARMRKLGLDNEDQLQGWLIGQVAEHLSRKGKRVVGWDEMLDCGPVSKETVVMNWRNVTGAVKAVRHGNNVVMALPDYCNLDYCQADPAHQPPSFGIELPLSKVYHFNPVPSGLSKLETLHILGGQCFLWTDYIKNYDQAEYMLLPRLCAMSECLWTPSDRKDWMRFRQHIERHKARLHANGYRCCLGSFRPTVTKVMEGNEWLVTLSTEVEGTYVYYTLDGTDPTPESPLYVSPLHLPRGTQLRTLSLYNEHVQEGVYEFNF